MVQPNRQDVTIYDGELPGVCENAEAEEGQAGCHEGHGAPATRQKWLKDGYTRFCKSLINFNISNFTSLKLIIFTKITVYNLDCVTVYVVVLIVIWTLPGLTNEIITCYSHLTGLLTEFPSL